MKRTAALPLARVALLFALACGLIVESVMLIAPALAERVADIVKR